MMKLIAKITEFRGEDTPGQLMERLLAIRALAEGYRPGASTQLVIDDHARELLAPPSGHAAGCNGQHCLKCGWKHEQCCENDCACADANTYRRRCPISTLVGRLTSKESNVQ